MMHVCKFTSKAQFKLKQKFVVQIGLNSKPYYETLPLVPPYFKPEVLRKIPHLTHFEAEIVVVLLVKLKISQKVWASPEATLGKQLYVT